MSFRNVVKLFTQGQSKTSEKKLIFSSTAVRISKFSNSVSPKFVAAIFSETSRQTYYHTRYNVSDVILFSKVLDVFSLPFWHRSFTFNSNKSPTWCNNFSVYYPDVCLQLKMFRVFSAHHQKLNDCSGSLWFYLRIVVIAVLFSWSGRPENLLHQVGDLFKLCDDARTYKP